jgi:predicted acetyltransferase
VPPVLMAPTVLVREPFLAAMAEFQAEGRGASSDATMIGDEIRSFSGTWSTPEGFEDYVRELRGQAEEDWPRPEGWVPCTTLWWVDGVQYLGRIAVRHRLTASLRAAGGHIGYDVPPSARRLGHATAMLRSALPVASALGIDRALLTCDPNNLGSRTVIERNGGTLEDHRDGMLRFWIPTRPIRIRSAVPLPKPRPA